MLRVFVLAGCGTVLIVMPPVMAQAAAATGFAFGAAAAAFREIQRARARGLYEGM